MYNCDKKRQSERQIKRDKENAKLPTAIFKFVGHNLCTRFGHYTLRRLKTPTQFSFKSRKTNVNSKCMLSYAKAERTPMSCAIALTLKLKCFVIRNANETARAQDWDFKIQTASTRIKWENFNRLNSTNANKFAVLSFFSASNSRLLHFHCSQKHKILFGNSKCPVNVFSSNVYFKFAIYLYVMLVLLWIWCCYCYRYCTMPKYHSPNASLLLMVGD